MYSDATIRCVSLACLCLPLHLVVKPLNSVDSPPSSKYEEQIDEKLSRSAKSRASIPTASDAETTTEFTADYTTEVQPFSDIDNERENDRHSSVAAERPADKGLDENSSPDWTLLEEDILNELMILALKRGAEKKEACARLSPLIDRVEGNEEFASFSKEFGGSLRDYVTLKCTVEFEEAEPFPEDGEVIPDDKGAFPHQWQDKPICSSDDSVIYCRYDHTNGRGLFIMRQPSVPKDESIKRLNTLVPPVSSSSTSASTIDPNFIALANEGPNYLICSVGAMWKRNLVSRSSHMRSRCRVSGMNIEKEMSNSPVLMRPDLKGLLNWPNIAEKWNPVIQPDLLAKQCEAAFPKAYFCSPTMIVLPTPKKDTVNVCALRTDESALHIPYFQMAKFQSNWECNAMDLSTVQDPEILEDDERKCVPKEKGIANSKCLLPHIPWRAETALIRSSRCFTKERGEHDSKERVGRWVCNLK